MEDKRKILAFLSKEVKEYVCVCGSRTMDYNKVYFNSPIGTNVDLTCKICGESRQVMIYYPDDLLS
jgi:hypothetical protein